MRDYGKGMEERRRNKQRERDRQKRNLSSNSNGNISNETEVLVGPDRATQPTPHEPRQTTSAEPARVAELWVDK